MMGMMTDKAKNRPYFLWDYDLTEADVRRILRGKNEVERRWMLGRILTNAHFDDIWTYVTVGEVAEELPSLRMRPEVKQAWENALEVWGYEV